ncbi:phosphopyruvate hydratase [Marinimicrococcus flavescens]|uniref:Enolase n=1 Tax=Marinimicrococcus flavescens TaxID=3031815 RepID=A0AAP3UZ00_9PROT|nr:phosphopyruvate hydratase [Marinimicrococcus flavescens]
MSGARIASVHGRRVWDSRGRPTVEVEVTLQGGVTGRAIAPAGASTGSGEALDLRDGGKRLGGHDVGRALGNVERLIAPALLGRDAFDQNGADRLLIDLDGTPGKTRLGGNATIATSMAVAHAAAAAAGLPLWRHLGGEGAVTMPLPEIQIFGGGKHAAGRLDIQDFLVVCPGAGSFAQALEWTAEVYMAAGRLMEEAGRLKGVADEGGFWPEFDDNEQALAMLTRAIERAGYRPGEEVAIALDVAASSFGAKGHYRLGREGRELDSAGMVELLGGWLARYPIVSVEDPVAEDDEAGFIAFRQRFGKNVQVVGDDFLVTDAGRVARAAATGSCSTVLLKPNQCGTLSETKAAWEAAKAHGMGGIVSARSGESEDVTIIHLAVGWGVAQFKVGSFTRSERMAKWNEGLRIEEALGGRARFAGRAALTTGLEA